MRLHYSQCMVFIPPRLDLNRKSCRVVSQCALPQRLVGGTDIKISSLCLGEVYSQGF